MTKLGESVELSVVVPMFDEAEVLPIFYPRLRAALDPLDLSYEVIAVDDGSRDNTARITESVRAGWPELRLVRLLRNSGHQAAIGAGLTLCRGRYAITIDADLQDPPEAIGPMFALARDERLDVVYGVRADRSSDAWGKRLSAKLYYLLMRRLVGAQLPADAGDFRLMSRRVLNAVERQPQAGRVYRLMVPWLGFPSRRYPYVRESRAAGKTKYPLSRMVALAWESVTAFSAAPLRIATWLGGLSAISCLALIVAAVIVSQYGETVPGWTSTLIVVMGIGAVQLICVGLLGEYVAKIFVTVQARPTFTVGYDSYEQDLQDPFIDAEPALEARPPAASRAEDSAPPRRQPPTKR
ncbi:MAG: glycosyltransferase family 2 protein [Actinomycetota bacterium]|nr:glycosyltransferase family 2 protein [Actinomycetota bacterium]